MRAGADGTRVLRTVAHAPPCGTDFDMDYFVSLLLLSLCSVRSEPLPDAVQRRSDKEVYASEYSRDYEPVQYAAIPLHSPIPVLHLLSAVAPPAPAQPERRPPAAQSAQRPVYALPPQPLEGYRNPQPYRYVQPYTAPQSYAASQSYSVSQPYTGTRPYAVSQPYAASQSYAVSQPYAGPQQYAGSQTYSRLQPYGGSQAYTNYVVYTNDDADESAPTILYARPNPNGGYTYRRKPNKKRNKTKRPAPPKEPVLIRVHKYKVVRDR